MAEKKVQRLPEQSFFDKRAQMTKKGRYTEKEKDKEGMNQEKRRELCNKCKEKTNKVAYNV